MKKGLHLLSLSWGQYFLPFIAQPLPRNGWGSWSHKSSKESITLWKVLLQIDFLSTFLKSDFVFSSELAQTLTVLLGGGEGCCCSRRLCCCCRCQGSFFFPFVGCVGSGRGGRWGAEEKSSLCTGSPWCEPGARVEAAFVFSVSWCLQQMLTTVEVYSVVSVFLNYLILCYVYMKMYLCIFHRVLFNVDKYYSLVFSRWCPLKVIL